MPRSSPPTPDCPTGEQSLGEAFEAWRRFSQEAPSFDIGQIVDAGTARSLDGAEIAAYDAPFPDDATRPARASSRALVPNAPDDPGAAAARAAWEGLKTFDRPFLCAFGDSDPITRGRRPGLSCDLVPGAAGQAHTTIAGAAHFCQEDAGPVLAETIVSLIGRRD